MLFNSFIFILVFFPIVFSLYFFLNKKGLFFFSKIFLVFSSLFFYSWWNIYYLPLILFSIIFNYFIAVLIIKNNSKINILTKKFLLIFALIFNISLLAYFKYSDFLIENTNIFLNFEIPLLNLALPLAISFFTLQQIMFLIDSYEGLVNDINFFNYTVFVTFFPQLISGPIVHHKEMIPQFSDPKNRFFNSKNISLGIFLFSIGLFKKVILADFFSVYVHNGFDLSNHLNFFEAWLVSFSYTFQLYFDFSGYTDMALGIAIMLNIKLPINFNSPYKSLSIIEFWQRWHITLTNFITTYLYTPMIRSMKRISFHKAMLITFITFLIAGIWHGASWMFIIFGALHGIGLVINHYWRKLKIKLNRLLSWIITFNFINFTFIFFRSNDIDDALKILSGMFGVNEFVLPRFLLNEGFLAKIFNVQFGGWVINVDPLGGIYLIPLIVSSLIIVLFFRNSNELVKKFKFDLVHLTFIIFLFICAFRELNEFSEFLYFNF
tara:strand:- start:1357 stop:2832 length:1476 start_codon:yes stop_codon:yes gene_type:complete